MKKIALICFILIVLFFGVKALRQHYHLMPGTIHPQETPAKSDLDLHATQAAAYAAAHRFNTKYCLLIDMNLPSGSNRFFVYDLENKEVTMAGLVAHGRCNQYWLSGRRYSNEPGSGCSSPGHYRIGKAYQGKFGLAYKLHGLDSTNSNAYQRFVVLHAHDCVPAKEVFPRPICQSDGCPTVSPAFLKKLAPLIDASDRPVLLYMYDSSSQW